MIRLILLALACTATNAFADEVKLNCPEGQSTQMVEYRDGQIPVCIADGWDPMEFILNDGLESAKSHGPTCPVGLRVGEVIDTPELFWFECVQDENVEILP